MVSGGFRKGKSLGGPAARGKWGGQAFGKGVCAKATPQEAISRAGQLNRASLNDQYARNIAATTTSVGGIQVLQVRVEAPLPVLGPLGPDRVLSVQARAFSEDQ